MDYELLNNFLISGFFDDYFNVTATDKAYELLGLNSKTTTFRNGSIVDNIDIWYYRVALMIFLNNHYKIDGLLRESRGNSHDASWEKEVTIFKDGGPWKEELDKYIFQDGSTFETKPEIIKETDISKKLIEEWSKTYDLTYNGESKRLIYCSYHDNSGKKIYTFDHIYPFGTPFDNMYNTKGPASLCLKKVR